MTTNQRRAPRTATKTETVTERVLREVLNERGNQDKKWGEQNHPLIGGAFLTATRRQYEMEALNWKGINDHRVRTNSMGWDSIVAEELFEALEATSLEGAREEYVQLAAVAVAAIESIDRMLAKRAA